jgi:hypothetical protein
MMEEFGVIFLGESVKSSSCDEFMGLNPEKE